MKDGQGDLTLENIANVKIRAYRNNSIYGNGKGEEGKKDKGESFYSVYILTYIKHIVRIKANLALHGGLYSNYFEKYEEESISNIMLENLLSKEGCGTPKGNGKQGGGAKQSESNNPNGNKQQSRSEESKRQANQEEHKDLNYSIKELLRKLIKSYKIRENKIFLVTGMLGCGKTTCVSLAIEYFNKYLQIEKNMNRKKDKRSVGFLSADENVNKKLYKKTPYTVKRYQKEEVSSNESSPEQTRKKIKINCDEPLFNFTPKKGHRKGGMKSSMKGGNQSSSTGGCTNQYYENIPSDDGGMEGTPHTWDESEAKMNAQQINMNIKNIFENNDLSPLRKNTNIRNKIQFEELLKEHNNLPQVEKQSDNDNAEFNEKYKKIVEEIKEEEKEQRCIYTIRISAYLYRDDVQCIRSILTQLQNYVDETDSKIEGNLLLNDYIIKLEKLLIQINNEKKQTLLIIENVEKFCLQTKQNLLYTLFDLLHRKNICINIICLTNVLDITQTLEKRIKSRFTFEMLHISPILNIDEISKLVYKILYVNLDDFHLIKKYYSVYFTYVDLIKIQKFLQIYNSTMQKEIADELLLKQWSYDINYGLDIRHIYHTCVDAILSICEYRHILSGERGGDGNRQEGEFNDHRKNPLQKNALLDDHSENTSSASEQGEEYFKKETSNSINCEVNLHAEGEDSLYNHFLEGEQLREASPMKGRGSSMDNHGKLRSEKLGIFSKEKKANLEYLREQRPGKLDCTPVKRNFHQDFAGEGKPGGGRDGQFHLDMNMDMSPRKLKENIKLKTKVESQYILNNVQSKFIRRHYIKKVLRDLCTIEYMILCAFTRLYKKELLPKTLYVILLEINKFKQAYPQEQIVGFSLDAYRRSFFRLVDLDIITLSSYSLSHLNIKNFSNDLFGLHEPTKFPCYDIFLENIESYNLNHNLIQWVKHNTEVMQ
ncbi:conserved Plasmodium protein, unknown function [Plasmodium knowlesi strain H]|uniref:Origin recognition complex subunit 4 n=3 Tax=Plasmodium knowlesi TaxID=5850 RepID=A0A5K1UN20_PLAKH|nr:conserved protein, unknown function [Plasmodium knowlesi strain H]OTN66231.1 Uncharacterized protein PKNOH_S09532400 [Plasmodium knowlesi]CAA9989983.1 conserved protein, unknown function [Plasmodium knowlesi strain H]SBO24574.1 conserved Plasmodium protein, unknown function [Plasmodium knowlesi strain H]SBO26303.1 conserved Plasmodium protein, unknown function [Plasmodium knowlesi strain H]VVS79457.1 conserved protein, unknown function [Plasmodium knowlesi strain H]|eukprot:XP_002259998.1 hypothetical protein, conserved in Plasmodium species [Plasmodium knowlesi strain H]